MGLLAHGSAGRRGLGILSVLAFVLVACGGDGDGGGDGGGAAPATTTTAPAATPSSTGGGGSDPAKLAKAKAAVLQMSDFPPGWSTHDPQEGLNIEMVWEELTRCVGGQAPAPLAKATSETYLMGLATQARSTVEYTTEAAAAASAAALAGPKFQGCAADAFKADVERSKPEGSTAGSVQVAPRDFPPLGQRTLAWRINATVNLDDLQVPLFQDFLVIFNGGTVIRLFFLNPGSEFPQMLERTLVEKVVSRA
jgi:hypothetical protein